MTLASSATALPHAGLSFGDHGVLIDAPSAWGLDPIALMRFPKSLTDTMVQLASQFLARHNRCLAVLLLLDCKTLQCDFGVPRQRVARDAACWQAVKEDFLEVQATTLVIGSLQFRRFGQGEEPNQAVPPVDGVHLVVDADHQPMLIHCFIRVEGLIRSVPAIEVILDDVQSKLETAESRIEIL